MATDTSLSLDTALEQDVNTQNESDLTTPDIIMMPQVDDGPEKKKISQQNLNDFYATVEQFPDYSFEEAIEEFPEIKENEELFDIYSTYYVTRKAGEFTPEELNQKMIETYGYDIDKDADFNFDIAQDDTEQVQQGDGLSPVRSPERNVGEIKKEKYGEVPIIQQEFFPQKEKVAPKQEAPVSPLNEEDQLGKQILSEANQGSFSSTDRDSDNAVLERQRQQYNYGQYVDSRELARKDSYKSIEQITKESEIELTKNGRKPDEVEVQTRVAQRLNQSLAYASESMPQYTGKQEEKTKELLKIIDEYNTEQEKFGLANFESAYTKADMGLKSWMVSTERKDGTPLSVTNQDGSVTVYTNGDALKRRDQLSEQLLAVQKQLLPLNDAIFALDRTPGDGRIDISKEQSDKYGQLMAQIQPLLNQEASLYKEYQSFSSVSEEYANQVTALQEYAAAYNLAKSKINPELSQKASLAVAQMRTVKENWERFLQSEGLTQEEYDKKMKSYTELTGRVTKFRNTPKEEIKNLDNQLLGINQQIKKATDAKNLAQGKLKSFSAQYAKECERLGIPEINRTLYLTGKGTIPESIKPILDNMRKSQQAVVTFDKQIGSLNNQIVLNTEKSHKYAELQKYMDDPQWKIKQRQKEVDAMSRWEKAGRILAEDLESSMISMGESFVAMADLAANIGYDIMFDGSILPAETEKKFRAAYIDAHIGAGVDLIERQRRELEDISITPYISNSMAWKTFDMFSSAFASLAPSVAGTMISGGNPFVGGSIAFAQVYGDSYYTALESGIDDAYLAHLYAGAIASVAMAGEKYALSKWVKSLEGTSKASLNQYIRNAIKEQGGKVTKDNILNIAKTVGINIGRGALPEGWEEGFEQVFSYTTQYASNMMGANFETPESIDAFLKGVLESTVGGLTGGLLMSVPASFKTMIDPGIAATVNLMATSPDGKEIEQRFFGQLDAMLAANTINQENYDKLVKRVEDIRALYESGVVPKSITNKDAFIKAAALLQEKQELSDIVTKSGPALANAEVERIAEIDRMLEYIGKNNKPAKEKLFIEGVQSPDEYVQMAIDKYYTVNVEPVNKVSSKLAEGPLEEADVSNPTKDVGSMVAAISGYDNPNDVIEAIEYSSFHNFPKGPTKEENDQTIRTVAQKYFEYKNIPEDQRERYHDLLINAVDRFFETNPNPSAEPAPFILELPNEGGAAEPMIGPQNKPESFAVSEETAPQATAQVGAQETVPQQAAPKAPRERKGRQKVRELMSKRVFPKRQKPTPQTPETPNGVPVTATEEQQKTFADTPISSIADREGSYVNYQGVEGTLVVTADGLPAVKTSDGSNYVIEGALPDRSMADVGIELVRDFDTQEAMTPDEVQAINETDETDATAVVANFDNNKVNVYGNDYEYVRTNVDAEEDVTSVTLKDVATGKEITVRNENLVFAIEEAKIRFEQREGAPEITVDDVKQAAESIGLQPITTDETTTTQQAAEEAPAIAGGKRTRKVQPKRQGKAPVAAAGGQAVNAPEYAQRLDAAKKKGQELVNAPEVGVQAGLVDGMAAAIATSLNSPEQAKKFAAIKVQQMQPGKPKNPSTQMFEAATGIEITNDVEANNAAIDKFFETQTKPEVKPTKTTTNAVQEQTAGQVPVQPEATVGQEVAQGKPQPETQVAATEAKVTETKAPEAGKVTGTQSDDYANYLLDLIEAKQKELGFKDSAQLRDGLAKQFTQTVSDRGVDRAISNLEDIYMQYLPDSTKAAAYPLLKKNFEKQQTQKAGKKTKAPKKVAAPPTTAQDVPTPEETKEVVGYKVANIRDLYNVNRTLFKKSRLQSLASAIVMDRLIKNRAAAAGMTTEQMYAKLEFRKAPEAANKNGKLLMQMDNLFHSSPHYFSKFVMDHVGAGEGMQYYGYGLYFTTGDRIRQSYLSSLGKRQINISFDIPINDDFLRSYNDAFIEKNGYYIDMFLQNDEEALDILLNELGPEFDLRNEDGSLNLNVLQAYTYAVEKMIVSTRMELFDKTSGLDALAQQETEFALQKLEEILDEIKVVQSFNSLYSQSESGEGVIYYKGKPIVNNGTSLSLKNITLSEIFDQENQDLKDENSLAGLFTIISSLNPELNDIVRDFDDYYNSTIDSKIESGIDVTSGVTEMADAITMNRFIDYVKKNSVEGYSERLDAALKRFNVKVDTSAYSYLVTAFKDIKQSKDRMLHLHQTLAQNKINDIINLIKELGLNEVPADKSDSIAYKTRALIFNSILKYNTPEYQQAIASGKTLSDLTRPDFVKYFKSINEQLRENDFQLVILPPLARQKGNNKNNATIHIIDRRLLTEKQRRYIDNEIPAKFGATGYDENVALSGTPFFFGKPTSVDSGLAADEEIFDNQFELFSIVSDAEARTFDEGGRYETDLDPEIFSAITALNTQRTADMPNMVTKLLMGAAVDFRDNDKQILAADARDEEFDFTITRHKNLETTGFDFLHTIESGFAAVAKEKSDYAAYANEFRGYKPSNFFFYQSGALRKEYQSEATNFLKSLGYLGNIHPNGAIQGLMTQSYNKDLDVYNLVIFDAEYINVDRILKFQNDEMKSDSPAKFAADAQTVLHVMEVSEGADPVATLVGTFESYLSEDEKSVVVKAAKTGSWTTDTSEFFRKHFLDYLAAGKTPFKELQKVFDKFKQFLFDAMDSVVKNKKKPVKVSKGMQALYDSMLAPVNGKVDVPKVLNPDLVDAPMPNHAKGDTYMGLGGIFYTVENTDSNGNTTVRQDGNGQVHVWTKSKIAKDLADNKLAKVNLVGKKVNKANRRGEASTSPSVESTESKKIEARANPKPQPKKKPTTARTAASQAKAAKAGAPKIEARVNENVQALANAPSEIKKAKDRSGLKRIYESLFGLDKRKAEAASRIADMILGTIAKRQGITLKEVYDIISYQRTSGKDVTANSNIHYDENRVYRGAMTWIADAEAIMYALDNPNVSTPMHEMAHIYEKYLTDAEVATISGWFKADAGSVEFSEKFARGFEKYLYEGVAPSLRMKEIFDNFKAWMKEIYDIATKPEINIRLNDDMRNIYAVMLGEKPTKTQTRIVVDDAAVSFSKSPNYVQDGVWNIYIGSNKIGELVYNRFSQKWEGQRPGPYKDISTQGRTEAINEMITRHNNKIIEDQERIAPKKKTAPAVEKKETPILGMPPLEVGMRFTDDSGQEYKIISLDKGNKVAIRRTDSGFGKMTTVEDLRTKYANGNLKFVDKKAKQAKQVKGLDNDINDLAKALGRKQEVSTSNIGPRGEEATGAEADELYDIDEAKRIGPVSTRMVQSLGKGRVIKVADNRAGMIQNLAEGVESFTPIVLESGKDYVIVEEIPESDSKALESFRNFISNTKPEDWSKKSDKLRTFLDSHGLSNILNKEYSLLYGDITAADQWGERNGQIMLLDAGSLVAGYQQKKEFDKAEAILKHKSVVGDEILISDESWAKTVNKRQTLLQAGFASGGSSPWSNLMASNPKAHRAIVRMTKKLINANGNSANDVAMSLSDTIELNFPDLGPIPKDIAFDYVVKAMSEMGIQPDFSGVVQQPDETELSAGSLDEKSVFDRIKDSPTAPRQLKAALTRIGRFYEIESQSLADELANALIDEYGMNAAIAMVKDGIIKGATASYIYGNVIDRMSTSGAKFSSIANVINEFALFQRQLGRGISALNDIYVRSPQGLYYMALNAMNQTNAQAVSSAMAPATGLSGALATATQAAAGQVANNMTRNASTGVGSISTAVSDLVRITQEERLKTLKAEAKGLLDQLRGIGNQLPLRAPTPKVQALQNLNKFDIVVQLGANFIKRGAVRFNIWSSRFKQSLSSVGISLNKDDLEFIWETNEIKTAVQDVLDSGLAPLDGPIKDYMKSMQIKLADIVRKRAAERDLEIDTLANDIATSLSVDPAVATRLATAIKADIDAMSKKMQEKIVKNFHDKMKKKYGTNVDAEEVALESLMNLVNNNQADPLAIAEAIKFAFGGVAMSDAQSDEFIRLAENVFKTREGSKNRQIMQKKLLEFTNSLYPTSFWDKYWIFFYANQLAGVTTQLVNTLGNFYNSASQSIVYAAQDIRNTARMGASYSVKDLITSLSAQIGGGLDNAATVMNTGIAGTGNKYADLKAAVKNKKTIEDDLGYRIESVRGLSPSQAITQSMLNIWNGFMMVNQEFLKRFPNRFMTAVDNAFFQNNFERSIRRQTINELYDSGLRGKDLRRAVNEKLYGTDSQLETVANMVKSEMDDVALPFFDSRALADYVILKQLKGDAKAMINILANQSTSSALPNAVQLTEMMQNPLQGPMITAALMQSDPDIINNKSLWSSEARVAVREAIISQNVTENIADRARQQSEYLTLKNTPEGMMGIVASMMSIGVNAAPPLRFLVPYVNVPFNIANMFLDWFPLTSAARAYGLSVSSMLPANVLNRWGVKPTAKTKISAAKFGLDYDPILHSEQKTRAMYSAILTTSMMIHFVGKALSDDEEEEGPAITGGLFGIPYDKLGKNQKPYTVKFFGEEFSYENTPLFLVFATIGNTCDVIRELKSSDEEGKQIKIENALTHTGAIVQYTLMSVFEALPINGLEGITEIFYQRKGTSAMPTSQKALLQSSQGLIKSLLTPVPVLGNNLVKQMEQFYDPRRYVNNVFDAESFFARATGHVIINTLSDDSIVMRDYLGREVVQYPGARNIRSLEITEKSEIDKYIYANNFNFIPVSKEGEVIVTDDAGVYSKVKLKDDVEMFNEAYSAGGEIMRNYLEEFLPTIRSVNDKMLEKALIHSANDHQKNYVIEHMRKSAFTKTTEPISKNTDDVFNGWGANKKLADGESYIDEDGSLISLLRYLKSNPNDKVTIADLRAALNVKTEQEKLREQIEAMEQKYNQDVNAE